MNPVNDPTLSPAALRTFYLKALEHPAFVAELTAYQVSELLKYAKDIYWQACELAANLLEIKTDYPYPKEYKGGKEFDYWLERQSTVPESQKVQALCARRLDSTPPATQPAKGTPAADVRRYFTKAAAIHGTTADDANALHQLAVWLLHWAERPNGKRYSLAGQMCEQRDSHPNANKFLKACARLHEALTPLAATEQETKVLLGKEYSAYSRNNLEAVLKWWAGWIREQIKAQRDPAGAYMAALKRMPIVEEHDNGTPRYSVPQHLIDWDGFAADIAPLRQAFDDALPALSIDQKKALRLDVKALIGIDSERLKRQQEMFERQEYFPANLPADYPQLRFELAGQPGGLSHARQWVSQTFWFGLRAVLLCKQIEARAAFEKLNALLGEAPLIAAPQPLDTPPEPADLETEWADLLKKGVKFSLAELDELLTKAGLLLDAGPRTPTPDFKGSAVVGIIVALREQGYLKHSNNAKIARILSHHYGEDIANKHTLARNYTPMPEPASLPYTRALAFLPKR
ncbi:hypothetical protein [Hymenobacter sp. B1770]|uniref:hypothetical protein n=1 Tax=Hymenobacter sp. B1770 TaxID=1718788 RepID=UPI003CED484F